MSPKILLSKALNAVSAVALSGVLLGSVLTCSGWAMLEDDKEHYKNHPASCPIQGLSINEKLSDEVLLHILSFSKNDWRFKNNIALLSTHFLELSCDPLLERMMVINSTQRLQKIIEATKTPGELSIVPLIPLIWSAHIDTTQFLKELLPNLVSLTALDLSGRQIGNEGISIFSAALHHLPRLRSLKLDNNEISPNISDKVLQSLFMSPSLTDLEIQANNLGAKSGLLAEHLANSPLEILDLSGTRVDQKLIFKALTTNTCLTTLGITVTKFDSDAFSKCFNINQTLTKLNLYNTGLRKSDCLIIANILKMQSNCPLKSLNLCFNRIKDFGAISLAQALKTNSTLTEINVGYNKITNEGCIAFVNDASHLKSLDLSFNNGITDEGAQAWFNSLIAKQHTALTKLDLTGFGIKNMQLIKNIDAIINKKPLPWNNMFALTAKIVY